ncbi:hypothetical protein [Streptomyces sp. NRRL F-5053]|uniref:hypothetical protein n=1 Tax=Streptomyces sp. NRRL F-5053 TaxID=1463854 RepID=UPI00068A4EF0|nr:hypothetical protein [Streptomyces sp. NRRL F-5053]
MVKLPLIGVLALTVWVLVTRSTLKGGHAVVCLLFGAYLADSSLAPVITDVVTAVVGLLEQVRI